MGVGKSIHFKECSDKKTADGRTDGSMCGGKSRFMDCLQQLKKETIKEVESDMV